MASGYALPSAGGSRHGHSYSHSYSAIHLSPDRPTNAFPRSNGTPLKKAVSNGSLYTHAERSRENSPSPIAELNQNQPHYPGFDQNAFAVKAHGSISAHAHTHSSPSMKSRPRGESDLGRPADLQSKVYRPALETVPTASTSWFSLPEALTSLLVPLPYVFASASYSSMIGWTANDFPPFAVYEPPSSEGLWSPLTGDFVERQRSSGFLETCIMTSSTLLLVGILAKLQSAERVLDRRKGVSASSFSIAAITSTSALKAMVSRVCSIALPFYAATQLGGTRVGLIMLMAIAADLTCATKTAQPSLQSVKDIWSSKVATSSVMVLCFITDEAGLTIYTPLKNVVLGYLALATSVLVLQPPLPSVSRPVSKSGSPTSTSALWSRIRSEGVLTTSPGNTTSTLVAGVVLAVFTVLSSMLVSSPPVISTSTIILTTFTVAAMAASLLLSAPAALRSESKAGLALGCLTTASCSFLFSPSLWPGTVCNGGLSALSFLGVLYDTNGSSSWHSHTHDSHDHAHNVHSHHRHHRHSEGGHSAFTKFVLAQCEPGSLVCSILSEKDSRRIAYFTVLNFAFMIVQGAYGYLSGSLGLLSDTVHMFFDCLGLVVGLGAAVASKWPTSPEKPYGWGKLNTLAGFGNGVFLMLVSIEFVWEAVEGILEQRELRHVEELLVVSTLGLLVNLVGLFAFGHAHAGHDHGDSHSHGHSHSHDLSHTHEHSHSHGHDHSHGLPNGHAHDHKCDHAHKSHDSHEYDHHNENMHGIFLHVAADAGGSLAVIISTALTLWKPWYGWDPLATIIIAILIFAAAVPLVISSGQKLLLVIPSETEYTIKTALQELGELRGVVGYAAPRFWIDDKDSAADSHGHHHHGHDHGGGSSKQKVMGVIHVIAASGAELEDVRARVEDVFAERRMDLVIHVECEGEQCWCGGGAPKSS